MHHHGFQVMALAMEMHNRLRVLEPILTSAQEEISKLNQDNLQLKQNLDAASLDIEVMDKRRRIIKQN